MRLVRLLFWSAFAAFVMWLPNPVWAEQAPYLGRTITDVRVEMAGIPVSDTNVLQLIETRVGEPLVAHQVRTTIDHLVGLGRFEDVRVSASASDQGVMLRWHLTPVRRISKITVNGNAVLDSSAVRTELIDRHAWRTRADARLAVFDFIEAWYNPQRRHSFLGQLSPAEYERRYRSTEPAA